MRKHFLQLVQIRLHFFKLGGIVRGMNTPFTPSRITFGSVCSGIEAASAAWAPLGWQAAWFSEIEPFPSAVLAHRYPDTPNLGDMTLLPDRLIGHEIEAPDVFCGGTPCQAFSVAGLRKSLNDARGNLSLTFCEIADAIDRVRAAESKPPAVIFWENVPGVLSTKDNAFGCFLAGLAGEDDPLQPPGGRWSNAGCVYGPARTVAWRILDAQYFGLAQRRKRVFVVASARDGFDPAAVLFEFEGVRRDSAPSRESGKDAPGSSENRAAGGDDLQPYAVANCLTQRMHKGINTTLDEGQTPVLAPVAFHPTQDPIFSTDGTTHCMGAGSSLGIATVAIADRTKVRRLTPVECERLQGFSDNYTAIPWRKKPASKCPDEPRYKALGNSWAVPVVRWIGERIAAELALSQTFVQDYPLATPEPRTHDPYLDDPRPAAPAGGQQEDLHDPRHADRGPDWRRDWRPLRIGGDVHGCDLTPKEKPVLEQKIEELTNAINALTGMLATIGLVAKEANAPTPRGRKPKAVEEAPAAPEPAAVEEAPEPPAAAAAEVVNQVPVGDVAVNPAPTPEEIAAAVAKEAPSYTQGQIADLVLLVAKVRGRDAALAALAELGVRKASELDPAQYAHAAEVLNAAAKV